MKFKFTVDQHVEESVKVGHHQTNNNNNETDKLEQIDDMGVNAAEYFTDEDGSDIIESDEIVTNDRNLSTPTTNESSVLQNEGHLVDEQFSSGTQVILQQTTEYEYVSDAFKTSPNVLSANFPSDNDEPHEQVPEISHEPNNEQNDDSTQMLESIDNNIQSSDITQSGDVTTTHDVVMDVQAEDTVGAFGSEKNDDHGSKAMKGPMLDESEIPLPRKRVRKMKPELEEYLKGLNAKKAPPKATPNQSANVPTPSNSIGNKPKSNENRKRSMNGTGKF